jgi:hypothetical protein
VTVHTSSRHEQFGSELIPEQVRAARIALMESQRELPRGSVAWRATRALIQQIDVFVPAIAETQTRSTAVKRRASGRPEGVATNSSVNRGGVSNHSLETLAEQVLKKDRIGKYDVQALRRHILIDGITSRAEAEFLIALDRKVASVHFSWSAFFIAAMTEFVVWQSGEVGFIDQDKSAWLRSTLAGECVTDRARRALVAIAREARAKPA